MTAGRDRIVEVAFELFLTHGYERTSMATLVRVTGLSKGAVYHHFSGKEALRDAVIEHFWLRYMRMPDASPATEGPARFADRLHQLARGYADLLMAVTRLAGDPVAYYRFIIDAFAETRPLVLEAIAQTRDSLATAALQAQADGELTTALAAERIAVHCVALIEGAGLLCGMDPERDPHSTLARTVDDFLTTARPA